MRQLKLKFQPKHHPGRRKRALCHPEKRDAGYGYCKSCYNKHRYRFKFDLKQKMQTYAEQRPDMRRATWRKHAYGLSMEECQIIFDRQGGCCGICEEPGTIYSLNIDHDHVTGYVRGMLCGLCNRALGQFRDRIDLVNKAQEYMNRWETFVQGGGIPIGQRKREQSRNPRFRIYH